MRFLILTQYFYPEIGAPQVRLAAMAKELLHLGHQVEVVTALPNYPEGKIFPTYQKHFYCAEEWETIRVHRVWLYAATGAGWKRLLSYCSFLITAFWGIRHAQKPDYLFVESPPLFLGITAYLVAKYWQVPFIFNVADLWPDSVHALGLMRKGWALKLAEKLEHWLYTQACYINAVTEGNREVLIHQKHVEPTKVLFLPNAVDTQLFHPQPPDLLWKNSLGLPDKPLVLYAGTHGYAHGMDTILEAAQLLPDVIFLLVGGGSEKDRLQERSQQMKLENIIFWAPQPPTVITRLYSLALAGLSTLRFSSLSEGTRPVKILAVMACGKPLLYSGVGEGAQLVEEAQAGLVLPPDDPVALAQGVHYLLEHPQEAQQFGLNGRRYVEKHFQWSVRVGQWVQNLQAV